MKNKKRAAPLLWDATYRLVKVKVGATGHKEKYPQVCSQTSLKTLVHKSPSSGVDAILV